MRGPDQTKNRASLTRAAFCCAALVLALLLLQPMFSVIIHGKTELGGTEEPAGPKEEAVRIVFLGDGSDPFCAPLYPVLEELCAEEGWRLVSYDCRGGEISQKGQIEDFLRTETADLAVIYPVLEPSERNTQIKALAAKCPVVTVGNRPGVTAERYVAAHVGGEEGERLETLCGYLKKNKKESEGVLLLMDYVDEAAEGRYQRGFSKENVEILGKNYTWGAPFYAERYLTTALDDIPAVGGVVCVSRHGTQGTLDTLRKKGMREDVKIAALFYEPAMADDLALGELDAAVAFSPKEAGERLEELLPKVLKKETVKEQPLTPVLLTPENINKVELGYE